MSKAEKKRRGTETSAFGVGQRSTHDSSRFYNSRLYEGMMVERAEDGFVNPPPEELLDQLFCSSSEGMKELPDNCVQLIITSPPYNVTKEYDQDMNLEEYLSFLIRVWAESYRVLAPGGRACVNIANLGRKPYIPLHSYIIQEMLTVGFLMRGEIIWDKGASAGNSTAWGSFQSAANPVLRDVHEYILIFSKDSFGRKKVEDGDSISKEAFLEYTRSVWSFPTESARKIGHPAPFPVELPLRLIELYSFRDDLVLDPFVGSGSTCVAAIQSERHYVGYDIDAGYIKTARKRILAAENEKHKGLKDQ